MKYFLTFLLLLLYIFSSGFLENRIISRVVLADLLLVALMPVALLTAIRSNALVLPTLHIAAFMMIVVFLISAIFAQYPEKATFELAVIFFSFLGSLVLINLLLSMPSIWIERFFTVYVFGMGAYSGLCLVDFLIFPNIFPNQGLGGLVGAFRNTGQAGSFFGVHVVLCLALLISGVVPRRPILLGAGFCVALALVFTLKRASIIAVVCGLFFMVVRMILSNSKKDKKRGLSFLAFGGVAILVGRGFFQWSLENTQGLAWRFGYKFSREAVDSFSNGFFAENLHSTFEAFSDKPLIGVGLANVEGVYQFHEIHSTYLAILAYGGVLGTVFYLVFMFVFLQTFFSIGDSSNESKWSGFLYTLFPLVLGQMIGWGYTYHVRKREFWIMVAFVVVAKVLSQRRSPQQLPIQKVSAASDY